MEYIGVNGERYSVVEPPLGRGGEGAVYQIAGAPGSVAKVFKQEKRTESRHRKLLVMLHTAMPDSAMEQITWPLDVIYENGSFVGYIMPKIKNSEDLNVMYSDKYSCTLLEKITIAKNLCAAINSVHNAGQVCGDLNPKNISVDPSSARVVLVDTDSYHITEKNGIRVYRCEVGLPEYLPREVQEKMRDGNRLESAPLPTFTRYTDLFALAIHIFALLMNGCHPFACAVDNGAFNIAPLTSSQPSVSAPQPIDNICTGFFPFQMKRNGITTPKYAPDYDYLPTKIRALFSKAFINGHTAPYERPDCIEWYQALDEMQTSLRSCRQNPSHLYPRNLSSCPWCDMENRFKTVPRQLKQTSVNTNQHYIAPRKPSSRQTTNATPVMPALQSQQTSGGASTIISNQMKSDGIMASSGMFWFLTLAITLGTQALIQGIWGNQIVGEIFGHGYGSGIESWGVNLAVALGPWGFVICGLIGTCCYNSMWCKNGRLYGYKPSHYILSCIVSFAFSAAWILFIIILSIAIAILAIIVVIAVICGMLSGS